MLVMKNEENKEEGSHEVTFTVTIAKATLANCFQSKKLPKVESYFHCEYKLLPDDKELTQFDVISFGIAAKLYSEAGSKVLRTWQDGNKTWIAWSTSRKVLIDKKTLLKMFDHIIELNVWNTKEKVSTKARFDRPKAFYLPQIRGSEEIGLDFIKKLLIKEDNDYGFDETMKAELGTFLGSNSAFSENHFLETSENQITVQVRLNKSNEHELKNIFMLASSGNKPLTVDTEENETMSVLNKVKAVDGSSSGLVNRRGVDFKSTTKSSIGTIKIGLSAFFNNSTVKSGKLHNQYSSLEDVVMIVSLDKPLLSKQQSQDLNPMVITVTSATNMPNNSLSYIELKKRCLPPYIRYRLFENEPHTSSYKEHGSTIHFNDTFTILLGLLKKKKLIEDLLGPPLRIEVHDRDAKLCKKPEAALFGDKPGDQEISSITYLANQFQEIVLELSYGVAEFDLSELLTGKQLFKMVSLIKAHQSTKEGGVLMKIGKAEKIPEGNYIESGSELKIILQLARGLSYLINHNGIPKRISSINQVNSTNDISLECPFNRVVYIADYSHITFVQGLLALVCMINAKALDLTKLPQNLIDAALSTYKLSEEQVIDKSLDIITGCHIADETMHIILLEGLAHKSIQKLWNEFRHPVHNEHSVFRVLYNSKMSFSMRLYTSLGMDISCIKLNQPISEIVKQPLIYVRDMLPKLCFKAIQKIYQLCSCESLCCASRRELFPSCDMILSLKEKFGVQLCDAENFNALFSDQETIQAVSDYCNDASNKELILTTLGEKVGAQAPIFMVNPACERFSEMQRKGKLFNLKDKNFKHTNIGTGYGHYTFSEKFSSATIDHVDSEKDTKLKVIKPFTEWISTQGLSYCCSKSSSMSCKVSEEIPESKMQILKLPKRGNVCHRSKLNLTVDKFHFKWEDPKLDSIRLSKFAILSDQVSPVVNYSSGDTLASELLLVKTNEKQRWLNELVVDDPLHKTYRCLKAAHVKNKGPETSDRRSKLKGIRKDCTTKKSPTTTGILLEPTSSQTVEAYSNSGLATDNFERRSLKRNFNPVNETPLNGLYQDDKNIA